MTEEARQAAAWLAAREKSGQLVEGCKLGKMTKAACMKQVEKLEKKMAGRCSPGDKTPIADIARCAVCLADREKTRLRQEGRLD